MSYSSETVGSVLQLMEYIREAKDRSITSLSEYTKKTMVMSRAYIENTLSEEDGTQYIVKFVNRMLMGFVSCAVGLDGIVAGGRTVRDMASIISTEDFHVFTDLIKDKFGDKNVNIKDVAGLEDNNQKSDDDDDDDKKGAKNSVKEIKLNDDLFCGRLVEVNIADGKGGKVSLYFYVQIVPYDTPSKVMEQFIGMNFPPSFASRWAQFKAGEISFWKDLVFEADLVNKRKKALKADRDGILREMEDHKQKQINKAIMSMSPTEAKNHNSASSIIIVSRRTLERTMKDQGLDYSRFDVREKIMNSTMSLMLVVYDPNYDTVDLFVKGIQTAGKYSIAKIKASVGKESKDDLKNLMQMMAAGSLPRI